MKSKRFYFAFVLSLAFIFASCSSSQKTTGIQASDTTGVAYKDTTFVFDKVPPPVSTKPEKKVEPVPVNNGGEPSLGMTYYVVQIGAFTTKEKADEFAAESRKNIQDTINVSFDPIINLYVVQLNKHFNSHEEAEDVRNQLWKMNEFKDAWIVTKQK